MLGCRHGRGGARSHGWELRRFVVGRAQRDAWSISSYACICRTCRIRTERVAFNLRRCEPHCADGRGIAFRPTVRQLNFAADQLCHTVGGRIT